ncbi:MAG TPA: hypothetical protein VGS07_10055 [Thermoanaerobaculia bacterium]|nr:hypothetical protein [Thermoanaerobaculia bacterium]
MSRIHLVLGLSALLLLAAPFPGAPVPAAVRALLEMKAARPEPIEIEPVGAAVSGEAGGSGW